MSFLSGFSKQSSARLYPLVFLFLWAVGFVALKIGLQYSDPFTFLALRYVCVLAILIPLVLWLKPSFPSNNRGWAALIGVGLFLQTGYFTFTYLSLRYGLTAGAVALITCQQPILIALLAPSIVGERVTRTRWLGLILGVVGAVIVIISNTNAHASSILGLVFGVLALLSISCSTFVEKRFSLPTHPVSANLVQYSVGLLFTAPLAFFLEPMDVDWSWQFFASLSYLVFGASLLATSLLLAMIRRGDASRVSAVFFLVPPITALVAYVLIGESLTLISLPGMVLAVAGIYIVTQKT